MDQPRKRFRYRLNASGDFYVEDGCCASCGVPAVTAPELFGGFAPDGSLADGVEQCWVKRQPRSDAELDAMIDTMTGFEAELAARRRPVNKHRGVITGQANAPRQLPFGVKLLW